MEQIQRHHRFFSSNLKFFIKGGRISKTAGFVGTVLKICPLLNVSYEGKLVPREKIRTKKKAITAIVNKMKEHVKNGDLYNDKCYISMSACREDAEKIAAMVEEAFPQLDGKL